MIDNSPAAKFVRLEYAKRAAEIQATRAALLAIGVDALTLATKLISLTR